jgi:glycosyltransferase involved in cell wall biosynthesis
MKIQTRPRVIIDARMVEAVPHGIARYVIRLASGLRGLADGASGLPYDPVFLTGSAGTHEGFSGFETLPTDIPFLSPRELTALPAVIAGARASLYHSPSFASLFVQGPWRLRMPWVQTIHDLNHLRFGDWKQKAYYRLLLRPFARRAAALATVSEFSRQELSRWLSLPEARLEVVSNALEPALLEAPPAHETQKTLAHLELEPGKYFFCLSNSKPHKNLPLLVKAYQRVRRVGGTSWPLVLSVNSGDGLAGEGVRALGAVADREARVLRASAGAVVFPSLYEGFGLPPVEAAIAGVPLIVSDIPPHREGLAALLPDEAVWINPEDLYGWVRALERAGERRIPPASIESRQRILASFNEGELAARMDRIYRRVLA